MDIKEELTEKVKDKIVEEAKKKAKKEARKKARRARRRVILGILLFCAGVFVGVHWRVIAALIKGEELPEPPEWHFWCR